MGQSSGEVCPFQASDWNSLCMLGCLGANRESKVGPCQSARPPLIVCVAFYFTFFAIRLGPPIRNLDE